MSHMDGLGRHGGGLSDVEALARIDQYYAGTLGCDARDLRAEGWTEPCAIPVANEPAGPLGMRRVVHLLAPSFGGPERAPGVAYVVDELKPKMHTLLEDFSPGDFFRPSPLVRLDRLVRDHVGSLAPGCEPRLSVFYASGGLPRPQLSAWSDWIEPVEADDHDPHAQALRALYPGGAFIVRIEGAIVAYTGLRLCASGLWEVTRPRLTACAQVKMIARPDGLFAALIARASHAATTGQPGGAPGVPICAVTPRDALMRRALKAANYKLYANESIYSTSA